MRPAPQAAPAVAAAAAPALPAQFCLGRCQHLAAPLERLPQHHLLAAAGWSWMGLAGGAKQADGQTGLPAQAGAVEEAAAAAGWGCLLHVPAAVVAVAAAVVGLECQPHVLAAAAGEVGAVAGWDQHSLPLCRAAVAAGVAVRVLLSLAAWHLPAAAARLVDAAASAAVTAQLLLRLGCRRRPRQGAVQGGQGAPPLPAACAQQPGSRACCTAARWPAAAAPPHCRPHGLHLVPGRLPG